MRLTRHGFTLIELLIVVAIIAILAAIAVPNFLEAQMRSKASRAKADMRSVSVALEAYFVDTNSFPLGNSYGVAGSRPSVNNDPRVLENLSTPIAYITTGLMPDPFIARKRSNSLIGSSPSSLNGNADVSKWTDCPKEGASDYFLYRTYLYISTTTAAGSEASSYPSGIKRVVGTDGLKANGYILNSASPMQALVNAGGVIAGWKRDDCQPLIYDPTNGTVSFGNIWRTGGSPGNMDNLYGAILVSQK